MMSKHSCGSILSYILLAPMYVLFALCLWWWYDAAARDPVIVTDVRASPVVARDGDVLTVTYYVQRLRYCEMNTVRLLENTKTNAEYALETLTRRIVPEPRHQVTYSVRVPQRLITGDYQLIIRLSLQCNPLDHVFSRNYLIRGPVIRIIGESAPDFSPAP